MALQQVLDVMELLDGPVEGREVAAFLEDLHLEVEIERIKEGGSTDFLKTTIAGTHGRTTGGSAPTLGVVGRLGGIGSRPAGIGLVSDGDGAVAAIAVATRLAMRANRGDRLAGDVAIATHICPDAPTIPHDPVPFMGSPVAMETMNRLEVDPAMDAVITIDTTKGNRILNHRGIAITSTVRSGWVLPVAPDLVDVYEQVCGIPARVLPLSTYDITPYGNGLYHINSILQPAVATDAPVVGVAITAETAVAGSGTNASHPNDIALAVAFTIEVATRFGEGRLRFLDESEFANALDRYGGMEVLQTLGKGDHAR